ncbi:hepcidin-1-like [Rhinoderma darwinii]|uniref:hepcidin-1-like n=1 Tax=Rhinoderma darwinii TaxID=43563 RepID=UPI003F677AA3
MKSLTVCLILVLSVLIHQSLSATVRGNEIMNSADHLTQGQTEESGIQESHVRNKRHIGLSTCTYCCKCCKNKGCGYCCLT